MKQSAQKAVELRKKRAPVSQSSRKDLRKGNPKGQGSEKSMHDVLWGIVRQEAEANPASAVHRAILSGVNVRAISPMARRLDIAAEDLAGRVGMSRSTYHRKAQMGGTLDALGSDALAKYAALFDKAVEAFDGDADAARQWLKTEQPGLGNRVPLDFARSTVGFREVEKLLTRIDYGVYA